MSLTTKMVVAWSGCLLATLVVVWLGDLAWGVAGMLALGLPVGIFLGYLVVSRYLAPLRAISRAASNLLGGDLSMRIDALNLSGEWLEIASVLNKIAEQQRTALREMANERDQMRAILAGMSEGLIATDQVGRVIMVNQKAEKMLEVKMENVRGRYILETIRHHELDAAVKQVLEGGEMVTAELPLFPSRQQIYRLQLAPICQPSGRIVGAVITIENITELRQLEKIRSEFVANVSHELRTPLTSIKGFVETLLEGAADDPAVSRRFLEIIQAEADRLQRLVEDLFTLSRLENRRIEASIEGVDVGETARSTFELMASQAQAKDIELLLDVPDDLPPARMGRDFLSQVLVNLIDNAIKYTRPGGRVEVVARAVGHEIQVQVRDNGIGIPLEAQPRIFERFYRVDKGRSRAQGGTGLGLAIVKHIIEGHGGRITVTSQLGQGSTFTFTVDSNILTHF